MLKKLAATGLLGFAVAGAMMTAAGPASADGGSFNSGISGNQVTVPVNAPVTACGNAVNAVAVLSGALAACEGNDQDSGQHKPPGSYHH